MASIYDLKPVFQSLLRPLAGTLVKAGCSANFITLFAIVLSVGAGAALALWPGYFLPLVLLPPVLLGRMALNALDGMMAREHGQKSALGGLLNEVGDGLSDAALYLPFALHPSVSLWAVIGIVVLALLGEMVGLAAVMIGATRRYDGPLGKSDRAFAFGLLALLLAFGFADQWIEGLLLLMLLLGVLTIWNRTRKALAETKT